MISLERGWIKFVCDTHRLELDSLCRCLGYVKSSPSNSFRRELFASFSTEPKSISNSVFLFCTRSEFFLKEEVKLHQLQKTTRLIFLLINVHQNKIE